MGCFVSVAEFDMVVTELEKKHADNLSILTHLRTELVRISDEVNHAVNVGNAERKEMRSSIQRSSETLRKSDADRKAEGDRLRQEIVAFGEKLGADQQELRRLDAKRLEGYLKKEESERKSETVLLQYNVERVTGVLEQAQEERDALQAELSADKAKEGWYHAGEWVMQMYKGKFLEHWTCCQEVGKGNRHVRGCKKRAPPEVPFVAL